MRAVLVLSVMATACGGPRSAAPLSPPARAASGDAPAVPAAVPRRVTPPAGRPIPAAGPLGSAVGPFGRSPLGNIPREARGRDEAPVLDRPPVRTRAGELLYESKRDFWSPCVRDFVETQPETAREALGEALTAYSTACTVGPVQRVEFRTPRTGRTAPAQSHLGLVGALEPGACELSLEAAYRGEPVKAERITLIADGVRWSSPRLEFERDEGGESTSLPLSRALARVVARAIDAREAIVRFEGAAGYEDVEVSDEMKQDLRAMLDALDAINRP